MPEQHYWDPQASSLDEERLEIIQVVVKALDERLGLFGLSETALVECKNVVPLGCKEVADMDIAPRVFADSVHDQNRRSSVVHRPTPSKLGPASGTFTKELIHSHGYQCYRLVKSSR